MNKKDVADKQRKFLKNEFIMLVWAAAVQQRGAGKMLWINNEMKIQTQVRKDICIHVIEMIEEFYSKDVSADEHIGNIKKLMKYIKGIKSIKKVADDKSLIFTFATAQKLLNSALKYWWCAGWIPEPPQFPLDSINLKKIKSNEKWTSDEDGTIYNSAIPKFEELIKKENYPSLAIWELYTWQRRTDIL